MHIKALHLILALLMALSLSGKGFSQEVLCVHDGIAHLESEHPNIPSQSDELHIKLNSEFSAKVLKFQPDPGVSTPPSVLPKLATSFLFKKKRTCVRRLISKNDPLKTVRLLI
ncbi:MAG: hypothetical protein GXO18_07695 [Aquificae bacterium]|nr:hypothetical protein [Aquificota bacterium]